MREGLGRVAEPAPVPWGEELARLVGDLADPGRHDRGLVLLEEGAVGRVSVTRGCFAATVHGASGRDHATQVRVRALPRDEAARLFRVLLDQPGLLAALLQGAAGAPGDDVPAGRRAAVGALPPAAGDLTEDDVEFVCSCPDPDPVCKHVVALALAVADLADDSPASWLQARGVPLEGLTRGGRALVVVPEIAAQPLEVPDPAQEHWDGAGGAPALPAGLRPRPASADRDPGLLAAVFRPLLRAQDPAVERERVAHAVEGLAAVYAALVRTGPPGEAAGAELGAEAGDGPVDDPAAGPVGPPPAAGALPSAAATRPRRRPTAPPPP